MLPPAAVAIDMPEPTAAVLVTAAVRGCEAALGEGRCVRAARAGKPTAWQARIVEGRLNDRPTLSVELFATKPWGLRAERLLEFLTTDDERQRWASTGVVVAALVTAEDTRELPAEEQVAVLDRDQPPPGGVTPRTGSPSRDSPWSLWLDAGAFLGSGLEEQPPKFGGFGRLALDLGRWPVFALASFSGTRSGGSVEVRRLTTSIGAGAVFEAGSLPFEVEPRLEFIAQNVSAMSIAPSGDSDSGSRFRFGGRLGVDGVWQVVPTWSVFLGAEFSYLRPAVTVALGGVDEGTVSSEAWAALAGVRFTFLR